MEHVAVPQAVPTFAVLHWLAPLHLPGEHVAFAPLPTGHTPRGSWFDGTGVQTPREADWLHETHVPLHAWSQQTWSAQCLFWHSASTVHAAPFGFNPHEPPMHVFPAAHSLPLPEQLAKHVLVSLQT
jgi:hypothetical protein